MELLQKSCGKEGENVSMNREERSLNNVMSKKYTESVAQRLDSVEVVNLTKNHE